MTTAPEIPGLRILGLLGVGGTAQVYRAFSETLERDVAVKVERSDLTDESIDFSRAFKKRMGTGRRP